MNDRFLRACKGEDVDTIPIWFMRQAGRYLPEYREIREKYGFKEVLENPELAFYITLLPIRILKVDAAIVFSDLTLPFYFMGIDFDIVEGEGPVVRGFKVNNIGDFDPDKIEFLGKTLRMLKNECNVPIIGFLGGQFTLVSYLIEGRKTRDFPKTKAFMMTEVRSWERLMDKITENLIKFGEYQVLNGADALQIFDSWIFSLSAEHFKTYVLPYVKRLVSGLKKLDVPIIYFALGENHIRFADEINADVFSIDWRVEIQGVIEKGLRVQGNLDPSVLLTPFENVLYWADKILRVVKGTRGYIFNLGHGILPNTPVENLKKLVDFVHEKGGEKYG